MSNLNTLFAPPAQNGGSEEEESLRRATKKQSNQRNNDGLSSEITPLLQKNEGSDDDIEGPFDKDAENGSVSSVDALIDPPSHDETTPKRNNAGRKTVVYVSDTPYLPPIEEVESPGQSLSQGSSKWKAWIKYCLHEIASPNTWIGSFMFLLYHIVFCLTMGSAIIRPHGQTAVLGLMTKMAALGIIFGAPVYWIQLAITPDGIPALYPTVDLFTAPFLANLAILVDNALYNDPDVTDNDQVFLASFAFLTSVAVFSSALLLILASMFKVANIGSALPYPVIAGFFAAVGVLTWTLAFKVDSGGKGVTEVMLSGDTKLVYKALLHHLPSVIIAVAMKFLGPKNPFYVVGLVFGTIAMFYAVMFVLKKSLEDMIEEGWFWSRHQLVNESMNSSFGFSQWAPPAPLGWIYSLLLGKVHWGAVREGLETTFAFAFLYTIRCTLHGVALKKNVPNLSRLESKDKSHSEDSHHKRWPSTFQSNVNRARRFSEVIDIENTIEIEEGRLSASSVGSKPVRTNAKPTNFSLKEILFSYGCSQTICGLVGSTPIAPSVAASPTMYMLGAERVAPQLGSVVLLSLFYITDFQLVSYIPKPAFSALLVLAFIDMLWTWLIKSFFKTRSKFEWLVVPAIVIFAEVIGLLNAVFMGIAMSTLIFIGSFYRSGIVKYVSNGISIRSTIERPPAYANWLDENGELIQVLVLQNYLFFGNASGIQNYIVSMFEDPEPGIDPLFLPPVPKIIIVDLSLVSGIDTSAVDVFAEILNTVTTQECKLFLSGVSRSLRQVMYLGGIKPETTRDRSKRKLRFFSNLDAAIGKAEDALLADQNIEQQLHKTFACKSGFETALRHIQEQHRYYLPMEILDLEQYATPMILEPGEVLYRNNVPNRGLFFIESGIMKIERDATVALTRNSSSDRLGHVSSGASLNTLKARSHAIGREIARLKESKSQMDAATFRVARVGPGWVLGAMEALSGDTHPGNMIAVTQCKLHFLSYQRIEDLEEDSPVLVLKLHKLLAYLMAKRQSVTINQLATLHSIMSSPAQKKPSSRSNTGSQIRASY